MTKQTGLIETGPHMDWTKDNRIYERYLRWKCRVEDIFASILFKESEAEKCGYLRVWMGDEGYPYLEKWKSTGKLKFDNPVEVRRDTEDGRSVLETEASSGFYLKNYWALLKEELEPKSNNILSIMELWTKCKQGNTPLTEWITKVYNVVDHCEYNVLGDNVKDRIIRDVIIIGASSEKARDKIIRKGSKVTLNEVIEILQTEEHTSRTLSALNSASKSIHYVKYDQKKGGKGGKGSVPKKIASSHPGSSTLQSGSSKQCYRCKKNYTKGHEKECKALNAKCNYCGQTGHYEKCCGKAGNFPKKTHSTPKKQHVATAHTSHEGLEFYDEEGNPKVEKGMYMLSIAKNANSKYTNPQKDLLIEFGIGKNVQSIDDKVVMKIDTGADVNALNRKTFQRIFPDVQLSPSTVILKNFDNTSIRPLGTFKCFLRWKGQRYRVNIEVIDTDESPNVLSREQTFMMGILKPCFVLKKESSSSLSSTGRNSTQTSSKSCTEEKQPTASKELEPIQTSISSSTAQDIAPLTKEKVISDYADVFTGLGKFPGPPYELKLKPNAVPAKHRPRKVPVHLQEAFHDEVRRLIDIDVLEPVKEHTEWVNSYVIVEKDVTIDSSNPHAPNHTIKKKLRLCIDPKDLNDALEREPYYSRSIDELVAKFAGAVFFTIVDMDRGYWQVELHPNSRKYTCMALDIGRVQWKRLPMGTVVASDIFQQKLDSIYIGLPGVTGIADDMIIYGKDEQEHDRNLIQFLETTRKNGLRLNKDKLQFKKDSVSFFGHVWSSQGISPDPKKINSILQMEFPGDKDTMHSFLGLVNFLNRYSPKLTDLCAPLRSLLLKDSHYKPTEIHRRAFQDIKEEFRNKIILPYFSKEEQSILQTDASKKGFGAVLIQQGKPIYFASRALSPSEKNYQNLERECMAAVWGMEKFHYYLYGKEFTLQTDQKPLVSIFKKHMLQVSPRIQRIAIRSWPYIFNTEWISGKTNVIADALSRVTPEEIEDPPIDLPILAVNVLDISTMNADDVQELRNETANDPELQALSKLIFNGWPEKRQRLPVHLRNYWNYRDELTIEDGILQKNHKFIVPKNLQKQYLTRIHEGHLGISKCLQKAREYLFWTNYSNDIQEEVEKCALCQENDTSTTTKHKFYSEVPPFPWHTVGSDLFYLRKQDYLVLVDYFSKFLIVRKLPSSTSQAIKKEMGVIFSEYGRPYILRSDNGPCYSSQEFKHFLEELKVLHQTSSPHFPQGNGLAESMVKISKKLIEKAILSGEPWYSLILNYRITPISSKIPSPAEIFYGRKLRSNLSLLPSQMMNNRIIWLREEIAKKEGKFYPRELNKVEDLEPGQMIWHQDPNTKRWHTGIIKEKLDEPQSYSIEASNGAIYRRNRNFLKPRQTSTSQDENPDSTTRINFTDSEMDLHIEELPEASTSGIATSTSSDDQITPDMPTSPQKSNSVRGTAISSPRKTKTPAPVRVSSRSTKGIPPTKYGFEE